MNPYRPIEARIEEVIAETPTIKTFVLRPAEQIPFETGQFVELTVFGVGEAPFTPSSSPYDGDRLDLTVMNVGLVTSKLHEMEAGQTVGVRGPYGKGYPLDKFRGKDVLIVGGGVGLAPLRSLILALFADLDSYRKVLIRYGARTPSDIVYKDQIWGWGEKEKVDLVVTVDVGDESWKGPVGVVTTILDNLDLDVKQSVAVVCGPPIMMKFTTIKLVNEIGYDPGDVYLSMEKNMSCGIGKCGHCGLGPYYVCKDGPVFSYDLIKDIPELWD